jgi:putative ABC transport system ATP-binding protein
MLLMQGVEHAFARGPRLCFAEMNAPQGAQVLVHGPSGSGKSTLLAMMAGLLTPTAGTLVVGDGQPALMAPAARDAWRARAIGFLPQRLHLSAALTVQGNLELPFLCQGRAVDSARVAALLKALDVLALSGRKPHELSMGQAQRVALARALLMKPSVLLADEPTANLDDAACRAALGLLAAQAADAGATLVVATHDARVVQAMPAALQLDCSQEHA